MLTHPTHLPGKLLEPHKYAALQKLDDPNEICAYEAIPGTRVLHTEHVRELVGPLGAGDPSANRVPEARNSPLSPSLPSHICGVGCSLDLHDLDWPSAQARTCSRLLTLVSPECSVPREPFLLGCQADMATCAHPGQWNCSCATLSEYSRQCSMASQPVRSWRGPSLCCESGGGWHKGQGLRS